MNLSDIGHVDINDRELLFLEKNILFIIVHISMQTVLSLLKLLLIMFE